MKKLYRYKVEFIQEITGKTITLYANCDPIYYSNENNPTEYAYKEFVRQYGKEYAEDLKMQNIQFPLW